MKKLYIKGLLFDLVRAGTDLDSTAIEVIAAVNEEKFRRNGDIHHVQKIVLGIIGDLCDDKKAQVSRVAYKIAEFLQEDFTGVKK